ncbi:hypothetical protein A2U01_0108509, partial [Trifolium medium]|nr:hypothetical protein [Trifolium medium]
GQPIGQRRTTGGRNGGPPVSGTMVGGGAPAAGRCQPPSNI